MALWNPFGKKAKPDNDDPAPESAELPADVDHGSSNDSTGSEPDSKTPGNESFQVETPEAKPASADSDSVPAPEPEQPPGRFGWLKSAMHKTVKALNTDIRDLVKEGRIVDDAFLDELFADLIKTDMGVGPAGKIRDDIHANFRARKLFMKDLVETAKGTISEIMKQDDGEIHFAESGPTVIMVVGVNGAGKTTSIAKLAHRFTSQGKTVVLGAGDTFRAAAVEQLTIWAGRMGCEIVKGRQGSDPASVAYQAVDLAKKNSADICIVDTAGRLQTQSNLMDELGKIRRVTDKVISGAPHEVLLVLDATAGQNAISQARGFSDAAGCTGIILAKLDGTAKGGVAIPIRQEFGLPVKFIGLGETHDALAPFDVDQYVQALFDPLDE